VNSQEASWQNISWKDKTVFVTGATGFIGGRVCERLVQAGVKNVRALVHTPSHAARIARLPIQLCSGSLLDRAALREALGNSNIVVHCGIGVARAIVDGTQNLLEASQAAGVERLVHMSTAAVYGITPKPGSETEDAPLPRTGDPYCDNKGRAEQEVLRFYRRGLPTVILRPSIVYGPYSAWSTRLVQDLRENHVAVIDGGKGTCNTTYVDNLVDAIFSSIQNDRAPGQAFFITDGERISWGEFIRAHVEMLGEKMELPEISAQEIRYYYQRQPGMVKGSIKGAKEVLRSKEFRQILQRIPATERAMAAAWRKMSALDPKTKERLRARLGVQKKRPAAAGNNSKDRFIPDPVTFATQTTTVFFSIEKARNLLGYQPRVSFARGMNLVEQWLRFANYI
jgi:nucleoside-diphosphate-sugar epimerase